ncbi:thioredoxin domain-containing protein [Jatrophihabitans sp.]|uniref:thioredoxin domain-containing protein n=1 Tax=Jatrophihabitans sp. TaxID=1932789 RepID=UPI002C750761|nr:thioredoxin domain-containing protein [Jatrophihabitans sp.]
MANRLADATSPYLAQHADNPVDWWPWCEEAFAEARRRNVPVLLSVGYAACHWCHVMAHESFSDAEVAAALNARFVAIKVDREERPDIDAVYMAATTAMTGHGGWPMTCLLTPSGEPFFCGTYFPKDGFLRLLAAANQAWTEQQDEVLATGGRIVQALQAALATGAPRTLGVDVLDQAVARLGQHFDRTSGGYGSAPKFPPSMVLEFLLRHHARTGSAAALEQVRHTCEAMARGGIYDQLAGGFARYSVDAQWVVPHFEKMLYDNAQLLRVYLHLWRATRSPLAERIAHETAQFLLRDLRTPEGVFASALDADTEGVEGLTYAWTPDQLSEVLGEADGSSAAGLLGVTAQGSFELGSSTLQLRSDPHDPAWWSAVRARLLAARNQRPQPARDDKAITAWNGLAIAGLAEAGVLLQRPDYLAAARDCAGFLLDRHLVDGRLHRSSRAGSVSAAMGVAEDYGDLAEGLLALHQATAEPRWLAAAGELLEVALTRFADGAGGFFDTADDAEALFSRPRDASDTAAPSGQSALAGALLGYAALTGSARHREAAEAALAAAGELAAAEPRFAGWSLAVAEAAVAGPLQVAVVGSGPAADALLAAARMSTSPGLVLAFGEPDAAGVPLLADRPLLAGEPAAYVCRGFVCERPVGTPAELLAALG